MSDEKDSILNFLKYYSPGYIIYLYFVILILPILYIADINLNNIQLLIGLIFGGIPVGSSLGYIAYSLYDGIYDPYRKNEYRGIKSSRHIYINKLAKRNKINLETKNNIEECIMDYYHSKSKSEILSLLRRRWYIFHNKRIAGIISPIISIIMLLILFFMFWVFEMISLDFYIFHYGKIIIYYIVILIIIAIISYLLWKNSKERYEEADQIELMVLKENEKEILNILKNI